jgi:hypothetical protein
MEPGSFARSDGVSLFYRFHQDSQFNNALLLPFFANNGFVA